MMQSDPEGREDGRRNRTWVRDGVSRGIPCGARVVRTAACVAAALAAVVGAASYAGPTRLEAASPATLPSAGDVVEDAGALDLVAREVAALPGAAARAAGRRLAEAPVAEARVVMRQDSLAASEAEYQGWKTFHVYCYRCHGVDALGSDLAPNLRHSVSPQGSVTHEVFMTTVKNGRVEKGMPAWKALLTDEQIENLYAYVKARSDRRLAAGRPHRKTQG